MPGEQGYTSQVSPQAPPGPVQAGGGAFGVQLGAGIAELGGTLNAAALRSYTLDRQEAQQTQLANFGSQFAQSRVAMDATQDALKNDPNAPAGGAGYQQSVQAALDGHKANLFSGITETSVQHEAQRQWDAYAASTAGAAGDWANGQHIGKLITDNTAADNVGINRAASSTDPQAFPQELQALHDRVAALPIPADAKAKYLQQQTYTMGYRHGEGLNERDPVTMSHMLGAGIFDTLVDPAQLQILTHQNRIALDRLQSQKDSDAAAALAARKQSWEAALSTSEHGGNVPIATLLTMQAEAATAPGQALIHDRLTVAVAQQQVTAKYGLMQPQAVTQAADQLDAHIAALKADNQPVSTAVGAYAIALRATATRLTADATGDQWKPAASRGIVAAPIDINSPQLGDQLATRIPQAAVNATFNGPNAQRQILKPEEVPAFKTLFQSGGKLDQIRVMKAFASTEAKFPGSTAAMFNQIDAPPEFRLGTALMTGLAKDAPQVAADMVNGRAALQADPTLVNEAHFNAAVGPTLATALGGNLSALTGNPRMLGAITAARSLYAQMATDANLAPGAPINQALALKAANKVMGQYQDNQGVWRGGIGNHNGVMKLPDGISQAEFDSAVASKLPSAMQAAGVHVATAPGFSDWLSSAMTPNPQARTLAQITNATPINQNESQWDYQGRIGKIQGDEQRALDDKAAQAATKTPPRLPQGLQFRMVGDGLYQAWTGSGYLADPKGRRATWNFRTGKVGF